MKIVVIGGGIGGYTAAIRAAQNKAEVVLIEKDVLGGTCLNRGCIPTKSFLHDVHLIHQVKSSKEQGLFDQVPAINVHAIFQRKDQTVNRLKDGIAALCKANKITVINDEAHFVDENTITLTNTQQTISADQFIIATGSEPARLPIAGADDPRVWTSDDCFINECKPNTNIIIIGGGVIGIELATFYRGIGHEVTLIEVFKRILPFVDKDAANQLASILKQSGVKIITSAMVQSIKTEPKMQVSYKLNDIVYELEGDIIIQSVGRKANVNSCSPAKAKVQVDPKGILVNEYYQTNIPHIYAIGDVNGQQWLAHAAAAQAKACVEHIFHPNRPAIDLVIPQVVYSSPQIAMVGSTDIENQSKDVKVGKFLVSANGKHVVEKSERGFIKVYCNANDQIIGVTIFSHQASEMISYCTQAIVTKQSLSSLEHVVFPHPTLSEAIEDAFADIENLAIHAFPKVR